MDGAVRRCSGLRAAANSCTTYKVGYAGVAGATNNNPDPSSQDRQGRRGCPMAGPPKLWTRDGAGVSFF